MGRWALLCALAIVYASVGMTEQGFHFVPADPVRVWHAFLATRFWHTGSDQRPDWIANLLMLVPLGFLLTGALTPAAAGRARRLAGALVGVLLGLLFVLAVKYVQLFFPGRTVSLNYITAQAIGVTLGAAVFALGREAMIARLLRPLAAGGRAGMIAALAVYAAMLLAFLLLPFDIALSQGDWHARLAALPHVLLALPHPGRSVFLRAILVAAASASFVPVGALAALLLPRRSVVWLGVAGLGLSLGATVLALPILSATPSLVAIPYRAAGVLAGAAFWRALTPSRLETGRIRSARAVPWLVIPYLGLLATVNGLASAHWRTPAHALAALDPRDLIPLWQDYIVAKSQAAKSMAVHLAMYAPIGIMLWLRARGRRPVLAAVLLGGAASLAVELGRWMRPGLQPDFNQVAVGAFAAWFALRAAPIAWAMVLEAVTPRPVAPPPVAAPVRPSPSPAAGSVASAPGAGWRAARIAAALLGLGTVFWFLARYPLPAWPLAILLACYGAALWRWPALWLVVIPPVLVAFDCTMWTGWMMATESDAFLLMTVAVLLARDPPERRDLWPRGWPAAVLGMAALALGIGVWRGLASPYTLAGGSADPYLLPVNALRLAKGEVWAFALLPFLRARARRAGDAAVPLAWGMIAALAAVALAALIERALFPGVLDFRSAYRIAASFSSVQFGGDDIGTFLAISLPFLAVALARRGVASRAAAALIGAGGVYALLVTYSRTAYGAAVIGLLATSVLLWPMARARGAMSVGLAGALLALAAGATLGFARDSQVMTARLATVLPDFRARLGNWTGGLAMMDRGPGALALGMGIGSFPRIARLRAAPALRPSNDAIRRDSAGRPYLRIATGSRFYFGQKVPVRPGRRYTLALRIRPVTPGARLAALLCEKLLLYSQTCNAAALPPMPAGTWRRVAVPVSTVGLDRRTVLGVLRRPVELSLFPAGSGQTVDIAAVRLLDGRGRNLVRNGDFRDGTARWYPTDDSHLAWTIWNEYAASFFAGGTLGLAAWLVAVGGGLWAAGRAALAGAPAAAPLAGAMTALLAAGLFDDELTAPRMIGLIYLLIFTALGMAERSSADQQCAGAPPVGTTRTGPPGSGVGPTQKS